MRQYRQGDVFLMQVDSIPGDGIDVKPAKVRIVLAGGEATGHAHPIRSNDVIAKAVGTALYLHVLRETPNTKTAAEGVAWTFGIDNPSEYNPIKQT